MEVANLQVDREEAALMFRKYREHRHNQGPYDAEIARIYEMISKGKVVVQALKSIVDAGFGPDNLPKLAIVRADAKACHLQIASDGSASMADSAWTDDRTARSRVFHFERGSFPATPQQRWRFESIVPMIPPEHRPARGIQNYHILYEAEWTQTVPIDPMLLRRIGTEGDMWLVCAAWDLTPVERAVMAGHLRARG